MFEMGLALLLGYLLGSIPFGLLLTRAAGLDDIRTIGSGNIGSTNVLRTGRKDLAAATLLCDALKGTLAIVLARYLWGDFPAAYCAALAAFLGHLFPVWLKFKGGKGVATYIGCLLGLAWPFALLFIGIWLVTAIVTRYSSASALCASALTPLSLLVYANDRLATLFLLMSLMLWYMHRVNIQRLLTGTESRIGQKS